MVQPSPRQIDKLQTIIQYVEQRVEIRKSLSDKDLGSKLTYLEVIQQLHEMRFELLVQKKGYEEASAALAAMAAKRAEAVADIAGPA
jgi:hemolysin D